MRPIHVRLVNGSIERIAAHIDDPVRRLRFLNAVAPVPNKAPRHARWIYAIILALVILPLTAFLLLKGAPRNTTAQRHATNRAPFAANLPLKPYTQVWLVEQTPDSEVYSNGLRIDIRFTIANHARGYLAFPRSSSGSALPVSRNQPVGIVFHTTESRLAPFDPSENALLKRIGRSTLEYVREKRCYHFLIDRFGRVYRLVQESDAANHAGYSVWADDQWIYLNLNESFLGISFESQTDPGQTQGRFSEAQERSAAMLIELLRGRYRIDARNCVTHAQVSVNPHNMRVGYHTDWASGFPFERLGLPDNYQLQPAALWACGFQSDASYLDTAGRRFQPAVEMAEARLRQNAAASGITVANYRKKLQSRYRQWLDQARAASGAQSPETGN
jgi:hypothetical protein